MYNGVIILNSCNILIHLYRLYMMVVSHVTQDNNLRQNETQRLEGCRHRQSTTATSRVNRHTLRHYETSTRALSFVVFIFLQTKQKYNITLTKTSTTQLNYLLLV